MKIKIFEDVNFRGLEKPVQEWFDEMSPKMTPERIVSVTQSESYGPGGRRATLIILYKG